MLYWLSYRGPGQLQERCPLRLGRIYLVGRNSFWL